MSCPQKSSILSQTQNQNKAGFLDMWSRDFTCATPFPSCQGRRQTVCLFKFSAAGTEEMEVISLHPTSLEEYPASEVFLGLEKPPDKQRYGSVSISPVFCFVFCFSPHVASSAYVALPALSAGAGLDGHVGVNLQHRVPGFVVVEHGQGAHLLWDAAGLGDPRDDPDGSDYALDGSVVGRPRHLGENQHKREMKNAL